jgi:hypothetical protein
MRRASQQRSAAGGLNKMEAAPPTTEWIARHAGGFDRSLRNLGIPEAQQILAQLQRFVQDLGQGVPIKELRDVWDYKPIQGELAKKHKLMQIKPLRNYRVLLIVVVDEALGCVWFLEVHRRGSNDDEYRDSAIRRAQAIRNQRRES